MLMHIKSTNRPSCPAGSSGLKKLILAVHALIIGVFVGIFRSQFFGTLEITEVFHRRDPVEQDAALKGSPSLRERKRLLGSLTVE